MKKLAQGFNTAAQDSNPGSRSQESEALPRAIALYDNVMYRDTRDNNRERGGAQMKRKRRKL